MSLAFGFSKHIVQFTIRGEWREADKGNLRQKIHDTCRMRNKGCTC